MRVSLEVLRSQDGRFLDTENASVTRSTEKSRQTFPGHRQCEYYKKYREVKKDVPWTQTGTTEKQRQTDVSQTLTMRMSQEVQRSQDRRSLDTDNAGVTGSTEKLIQTQETGSTEKQRQTDVSRTQTMRVSQEVQRSQDRHSLNTDNESVTGSMR